MKKGDIYLDNRRLRQIQYTQGAVFHPGDGFDLVKFTPVFFGKLGQASELGQCVGQVVAVGIDDGDFDFIVRAVEEHEIGARFGVTDCRLSLFGPSQEI